MYKAVDAIMISSFRIPPKKEIVKVLVIVSINYAVSPAKVKRWGFKAVGR